MKITDLINKRALIKDASHPYTGRQSVHEVKFLETSSNEQWVKLQGENGNKYWRPITDISVVDVLKEVRPRVTQEMLDEIENNRKKQ